MIINSSIIGKLKNNGIIKINNFLNDYELKKIKNITTLYSLPKSHPDSYFATNIKTLLGRVLRLKFHKFKADLIILNLARKKKLNLCADKIFNKKSYLRFIDAYHSKISNKDVLPWHTDQAYQGDEKNYEGFVDPEHAFIKFFIYLTDVGPENGCMSYVPESHRIGFAFRKGILEKSIKYQPYYLLSDFRKFISEKEVYDYIQNFLKDTKIVNNFLEKTKDLIKDKHIDNFSYSSKAGDLIIFNELGVHRGSKSLATERTVLRYMYSTEKKVNRKKIL